MRKIAWVLVIAGVATAGATCVSGCRASGGPEPERPRGPRQVRPAAVAGAFYPAEAEELRRQIAGYLDKASAAEEPGELVALIAPHAGYVYSGPVAAHAYRQVQGKHYDTVVVVGPSHRVPFRGIALSGADAWATPLGEVPIDRAGCDALLRTDAAASVNEAAHAPEHSIEVQVPFLQSTLKTFKLLPVLMQDFSRQNCEAAARALADYARGKSVLLIASTDMSHYPNYQDAAKVDAQTLKAIETLDAGQVEATTQRLLHSGVDFLDTCLCGEGPVKTVLIAAKLLGAERARVLRYANSGDVPAGTRSRVVGYCAVAIYRPAGGGATRAKEVGEMSQAHQELNESQQQRLLTVARQTIEMRVRTGKTLQVEEKDPALLRPGAAFVTLRIGGMLRGCIGSLEPEAPLIETVRNRAISAAMQDPRFPPVSVEELPRLEIEISVLSPLRKVESYQEVELGKHGVVVEQGGRRGVFLPQVAEETGWDREEFLAHLCRDKAGLPPDAYKRGANLYVFTVQAFSSPAP